MNTLKIQELINLLDDSLVFTDHQIKIKNRKHLQNNIHKLAEIAALGSNTEKGAAQYIIQKSALAFGAIPSSIIDLYLARGRGEIPLTFAVPAINLRMLAFDSARMVFRVAKEMNAGAFIFEIARSEMGYTDQRPAEYSACVLAAAIAEGYTGPVFIQGDHFQISSKRYASSPEPEVQAIKDLIREALAVGFYNIDIDTSTMVDMTKETVPEQQKVNYTLSALYSAYIRSMQPEGIQVSIGGEIGEVGGHNSTEEELRSYMDGYNTELSKQAPSAIGLSKISIQTGTSHGGVVLPDGSIARVSLDFDILQKLSRVARSVYGMGGTVQHGASTLPETAFGKFVDSEAVEVHLATNFQNMVFDRIPDDLRTEMYAYLDKNNATERKPEMTDEQFYYKTRKYAIGSFKAKTWRLPSSIKNKIEQALEKQFRQLFTDLGITDTRESVDSIIKLISIEPDLKDYLGETTGEEVSDLAD
ncbi:MAG: class II fructose-bisphosphate aldolase [Anaerolineales bacterium]